MMSPLPPQILISGDQLGHLLRSTRKGLKLSQTAIANRLNLSQNRVSYLELHPDTLSFSQLLAWCSALGLDLRLGARDTATALDSDAAEW
ncbi:helix-turn-helix domain-containing protein [Limnohabitans planktonicus]|jgi:HTH-type transcriptional regulator/antitoxin HipB